jgi:hypothetical protein
MTADATINKKPIWTGDKLEKLRDLLVGDGDLMLTQMVGKDCHFGLQRLALWLFLDLMKIQLWVEKSAQSVFLVVVM